MGRSLATLLRGQQLLQEQRDQSKEHFALTLEDMAVWYMQHFFHVMWLLRIPTPHLKGNFVHVMVVSYMVRAFYMLRYSISSRTAFMLKIFHVMFSLLHVMVVFVYMCIHFSM